MRNIIVICAVFIAVFGMREAGAQTSTITYQGQLLSTNRAVKGSYDFQFTLWNAAINGNQIGSTVELLAVDVKNGLFSVSLNFDPGSFDGSERWLQISVHRHDNGGSYDVLIPRQPVTSTPYALLAQSALLATQASGLTDGGASLSNLNGTNIQVGSISSNQIAAATDAAYRTPTNALTNNYSFPLILGSAKGSHFNCQACGDTNTPAQSYSNVIVGADHLLPNTIGSSILFPDRGGCFWQTGAGIYDWNDHNGTFNAVFNELQVLGGCQMALVCYNAANADGGFQMGGSGAFHDKFWFQYDTDPSNPNPGFSKLIQFVTRSGTNNMYAYSAIRAVAADTTSDRNTLNFYSGTPSAVNNAGGYRMGTMLTNGWDFRGRIVTEHASYGATATNVIDWLNPSSSDYQLQVNSAAFTTANLPIGFTNNETRVVFIKSGAFAPSLYFPLAWHWLNESGNAVAPTNLLSGKILKLTLTALGPGDTNVLAEAKIGSFP